MFLIKKNTVLQVEATKSQTHFNWNGWRPYTTKEDKIYDKEEVLDLISLQNGREMPEWARRNITEFHKVILLRTGKYAMVDPKDIEFID